ncbi:hypothetical protein ACFLQR_01170 [Verrucomicrobiota bacterium]
MIWFVPVVAVVVATVLVVALWPRKGPWGINLSKVSCPKCGLRMPRWRRPDNERQMLLGGWTCRQCGCEMDKYGTEIQEDTEPTDAPDKK